MRKIKIGLIISLMLLIVANYAAASGLIPYASKEIHEATVALSAIKGVTFDVVVKKQSYKVHVNYCDLYRKAGTNTWEFVASMDDAIPSDTTGDMLVASDVSKYITKSGTYRVRACYTVGKFTVSRYLNERTFD